MITNDPTAPRVVGGGDRPLRQSPAEARAFFDSQRTDPAVLPEEGTTPPTPVIANDGSSLTMRGPEYLTSHWATAVPALRESRAGRGEASEERTAVDIIASEIGDALSAEAAGEHQSEALIRSRASAVFRALASRLTRSPRAAGEPTACLVCGGNGYTPSQRVSAKNGIEACAECDGTGRAPRCEWGCGDPPHAQRPCHTPAAPPPERAP